ncbi:MAG: aminotransferase class V-fold PLP-dependent enzyme [Ruminococcus sp.]|nr:MAG: aminotransferase class V-fold PLP-dependent enzyme [Ruminococcus sp.]
MIYFDSAATTYPKPASVRSAAADAIVRYGGNPGRSGHKLSISASSAVYSVREKGSTNVRRRAAERGIHLKLHT